MKHDPGQFTVCLWLSLQIPAIRSNWEDPASGFFSRVEASVSPPAERSGRTLWAGIRWEAENNWALKLLITFEFPSLTVGTTSTHIQSICDAMEIPHIETRWDFRVRRDDYSINLYPNPKVISKVRMSSFMTRYSNVDTERDQGILAP